MKREGCIQILIHFNKFLNISIIERSINHFKKYLVTKSLSDIISLIYYL